MTREVEQYGFRFTEGRTQADTIVVGMGRKEFWEQYGDKVSIVSWTIEVPEDGGSL